MNERVVQPVDLKVLSLEDSDLDFEIISEQIIKNGYNLDITRAISENEFTFFIRNNSYDIILADYQLPQFDAFKALKLSLEYCPDVPFVCVSGSIGETKAIELLKNGAVDYVLKDRMERLPFVIQRALDDTKSTITRRQIEESLKQSEEKYRTIFENVQDVFYQTDLTGTIKEISPSIKYFSDFDAKELVGRPVYEIYLNTGEREILLQNLSKTGEVRDYEIKLKTKSGEIKYASINARLIFNSEGVPDHIDGAIRDITLRKLAEESLQKSEEKYRTIFENVQDVFYQADMAGIIKDISPSIKYFSDFDANDLIGKPVFEIYENPKEREQFIQTLSENGEVRDYEIKLKTKLGELKYASINARLIFNSEGVPDHIDGAIRDITLRKLAEESLQQSESELNFAQKIAKMGSWKLDMITHKQTWSENMYLLLGFKPYEKEVNHDEFLGLMHPEDKYLIDFHMQEIIDTKAGVSFEFRFVMPGDEIIWIQNIIVPVFVNDVLVELHGVNLNITEKKKTEQELILAKEKAEASDRLKTSFLNMISHEIRTPLTEILGYGQVFTYMNLTQQEKEEYLDIVKASSKRLINTVTSFIDMSLITTGNQNVSKSNFYLEYAIDSIIESYKPLCDSKKIELFQEFPVDNNEALIFTDEDLFTKILNHLVDNSIKFTSNGSIKIGYQIIGNSYSIYIKDTGIGISDEMQKSIFKDFFQADNSDSRQYEGNGLGLSIASGLIKLLDGHIWVESEIGKGSTFHFSLPI